MRKQLAITFPHDHLFFSIDGMDNSKSYLPRFREKTKKSGNWKLPSKITGVVITNSKYESNRKVKLYINHDHFPQGSNMVVSIVYKVILDFLNEHKVSIQRFSLNIPHYNLQHLWNESQT